MKGGRKCTLVTIATILSLAAPEFAVELSGIVALPGTTARRECAFETDREDVPETATKELPHRLCGWVPIFFPACIRTRQQQHPPSHWCRREKRNPLTTFRFVVLAILSWTRQLGNCVVTYNDSPSTGSMNDKPNWKKFEELVAEIQKELTPAAKIQTGIKRKGRRSNQWREIDILVEDVIGQFAVSIAIDCKDYKSPVDIKDIESFISMLEDLGVTKGAIIAASGFSKADSMGRSTRVFPRPAALGPQMDPCILEAGHRWGRV
jgi:hypothetical protein